MAIRVLEPSVAHAYLSQVNILERDDLISLIGYFSELARDAIEIIEKAMIDYQGLATCASNNGLKATAKDALETVDYIKAFLEGNL